MSEISSEGQRLRIPLPAGQLSVNFCKNPRCKNFGIPASPYDTRGRRKDSSGTAPVYRVSGSDNDSSIFCQACRSLTRVKSNSAVIEELTRHSVNLSRTYGERCSTVGCANFGSSPRRNPELFHKHGRTAAGKQRFRCKACRKTTSNPASTKGQRVTHKNALIFRLLVHKVSINGIAAITGLSAPTVYSKIRFIAEQCRRFMADRERRIVGLPVERWYLSTDRQDYLVNWHDRGTRKTIQFTAIATACQRTGYVLACHPQYDPNVDLEEIAEEVEAEAHLKPAMRRHARVWTHLDYEKALAAASVNASNTAREDQDSVEEMDDRRQLPKSGAIVHADYMMYGHFAHLRQMLGTAIPRYRFFMDSDAGMDKACISIWHNEIANGRADIFQVTCAKNLTIDKKEQAVADANALVLEAVERFPDEATERQACAQLFRADYLGHLPDLEDIEKAPDTAEDPTETKAAMIAARGELLAKFIDYPFSTKAEPMKRIAYLTDRGTYDLLHIARLYGIASLHRVDNFFMRVRRRVAGLERGTAYPRRAERKWSLYAYYDPRMVEDMLTIVRCYVNYVQPSRNVSPGNEDEAEEIKPRRAETAAMRIGLAKGAIRIEDILYFRDGKSC